MHSLPCESARRRQMVLRDCGYFELCAVCGSNRQFTFFGATLRVFSPATTAADCCKFLNKIGLDVAIEALKECGRTKKASMDELWAAPKVYLESL